MTGDRHRVFAKKRVKRKNCCRLEELRTPQCRKKGDRESLTNGMEGAEALALQKVGSGSKIIKKLLVSLNQWSTKDPNVPFRRP